MLKRVSILLNSISRNCANSSPYTTCFLRTPGGLPLYSCTMCWLAFSVGIQSQARITWIFKDSNSPSFTVWWRDTIHKKGSWGQPGEHDMWTALISSPLQRSTHAGFWTPNPSRHIGYLLIQGQSFQKNTKTPVPLSISAANRGRTYRDVETQSW